MKENTEIENDFGRIIKRGDIIAYAKMQGQSVALNIGIVLDAYIKNEDQSSYSSHKEKITLWTNQGWQIFSDRDPSKIDYRGKSENKKITVSGACSMITISNWDDLGDSPMAKYIKETAQQVKENNTPF